MNPLITPQEAEKAARETLKSIPRYFGNYTAGGIENALIKTTEACNKRFTEDYAPVLEKCKEALSSARFALKNGIAKTDSEQILKEIESLLIDLKELGILKPEL